jgi:predicted Zn-dependent protease
MRLSKTQLKWGGALLAACFCLCAFGQDAATLRAAQASTSEGVNDGKTKRGAQSEADSDDPQATLKTLRHEVDTGRAADALKQIVDLRAKSGDIPGLSRLEGLADYAQGSLRGADTAFAAALKLDPNDQESAQMRGLTLFRLGRPADAIPLLEASGEAVAKGKAEAGKTDPNYLLALCYMDTRRYDDARHAFAAQYGFSPDSAEAYLVSARMLFRREYLPVAQNFAEKSIELEPNLPLAHELLGEIALAGNHLDDAISQLEKERAHNPLEGSVYDRLGDAYNRAGRYDEAQRSLQQALLLEPNSTGPYILLGKTLLKKNDPLGASTYLEHAEQMDPANYMTHSLLGQAYRAMGRREDAMRETDTAQKLQTASEPKLDTQH